MKLTINGEAREVDKVNTVGELLPALGLDARQVVVELNQAVIKRNDVYQTPIHENDCLEILRFVGGG